MTQRERMLVLVTLGVGLTFAALLGALRLFSARAAAEVAAEGLVECRRLADQIEAQRLATGSPSAAEGAVEPQTADVIRRIESAARTADFPPGSIERIEPGPARQLGETPLREKPTLVELRGVTLRQLFTFFHAAGTGRPGLRLKQVRLWAPASDDTGDRWSVESTLAHLAPAAVQAGRQD